MLSTCRNHNRQHLSTASENQANLVVFPTRFWSHPPKFSSTGLVRVLQCLQSKTSEIRWSPCLICRLQPNPTLRSSQRAFSSFNQQLIPTRSSRRVFYKQLNTSCRHLLGRIYRKSTSAMFNGRSDLGSDPL